MKNNLFDSKMTVVSPLTGKDNVVLESQLSASQIIEQYQKEFSVDVSSYFKGLDNIDIYQCQTSQLRFYYPFSLAGDGQFYADLARVYKGYYSLWKWEHEKTIQHIKEGQKILEIGCGNGYFLQKIKEKKAEGIGLDFNPEAVAYGKTQGIQIIDQTIGVHATLHKEKYDMVCAFQLFEHVNEVGQFIKDSLTCLKKGGVFAIGVPNNDSPIFALDPYHTLNVPPHHMLLWDARSLAYLATQYDLSIVDISIQPSGAINRSMAYRLWLNKTLGNNILSSTTHILTRWLVKRLPVFPQGATVVAVFRKN
ncbi:class I SAM-dependent methyltransferase [Runella sp. MFBS21]|uniref:class I SAM-dependent methyltransferase n=1 Tax=Runella sp. MFBS21 TaxID=3034018 RepID=UPI0023F8DE32|nr:class I SAM-dependent methyltransferase [Runella sp. MFBS21]MDF7820160.1 class I SAM-dependent methyltransferase [Runella sp. MFBS21]